MLFSGQIGVLGGGQLGQMLLEASIPLGLKVKVLDPNPQASCRFWHEFENGDLIDPDAVLNFGKTCDVITYEIEKVSLDGLKRLEDIGVKVAPGSHVLEIIQNKNTQKNWLQANDVPTSPFQYWDGQTKSLGDQVFPLVQKTCTGGYDGKGVQIVKHPNDLWAVESILEPLVDIAQEISIIVARNKSGEIKTFPLVEMNFDPKLNLVVSQLSPARVTPEQEKEFKNIALQISKQIKLEGLLAIECFVTKTGQILVNEMAPRPHNSGHHFTHGALTSQFEQHLRAICNLPLGSTELRRPCGMINLLGTDSDKELQAQLQTYIKTPGGHVHWYYKSDNRPGRKMGHINIEADSIEKVEQKIKTLLS